MFSVSYPTIAERQAFQVRAHRLRGSVVAGLVREMHDGFRRRPVKEGR